MKTPKMTAFQKLRSCIKDTVGVTMIEYALLAGLIAIAAVYAIYYTGSNVNSIFTTVANDLNYADEEILSSEGSSSSGSVTVSSTNPYLTSEPIWCSQGATTFNCTTHSGRSFTAQCDSWRTTSCSYVEPNN